MGKKKFNKKQTVRFTLVPGVDQQGNPTVLYKPVDNKVSKVAANQKKKLINEIADMDIEINGKPVNQSQIPSFVLDQIRGRADLIFNQKHPEMMEQYDQEDIYEDEMIDGDEEQWEMDQLEYQEQIDEQNQVIQQQEYKEFQVDGRNYKLTAKQAELLDTVIPQNYEKYEIEGVEFVKYDEDGNRLDQKQSYQKYLADENQKRAIIDSYTFVPEKMKDVYDSDLKEEEIKGEMRDIEDAMNYQGEQQAYEQLEDDFFANLLQAQKKPEPLPKKQQKINKDSFKKNKSPTVIIPVFDTPKQQRSGNPKQQQPVKQKQQKFVSKYDDIDMDDDQNWEDQDEGDDIQCLEDEEITDQMLDKAIEEFDKNISSQNKGIKLTKQMLNDEDEEQYIYKKPEGMSLIDYLQSKEEFKGKDGELDWRILTKDQKREFMKTKKMRDFFDEVREREIQEKMKNIKNVHPEQLHLKDYIKKIQYNDDHVIQEALKRDAAEVVNLSGSDEDYETESSEDDIISYRAKTSIISSNLATVQQPSKKKKKGKQDKQPKGEESSILGQKVKVVPEERKRNETKEERKARKQRLKQMKKQKKQQKKQFGELFEAEKKKFAKKQNAHNHNVLHKVSHVKII